MIPKSGEASFLEGGQARPAAPAGPGTGTGPPRGTEHAPGCLQQPGPTPASPGPLGRCRGPRHGPWLFSAHCRRTATLLGPENVQSPRPQALRQSGQETEIRLTKGTALVPAWRAGGEPDALDAIPACGRPSVDAGAWGGGGQQARRGRSTVVPAPRQRSGTPAPPPPRPLPPLGTADGQQVCACRTSQDGGLIKQRANNIQKVLNCRRVGQVLRPRDLSHSFYSRLLCCPQPRAMRRGCYFPGGLGLGGDGWRALQWTRLSRTRTGPQLLLAGSLSSSLGPSLLVSRGPSICTHSSSSRVRTDRTAFVAGKILLLCPCTGRGAFCFGPSGGRRELLLRPLTTCSDEAPTSRRPARVSSSALMQCSRR